MPGAVTLKKTANAERGARAVQTRLVFGKSERLEGAGVRGLVELKPQHALALD